MLVSFLQTCTAFRQQIDAKAQALPEMQALNSFTETFAGRQPTTQELAKVEELSNVVRNSAAFKALGQEQQDFDNRNKQRFDAFNRLREQNPNQLQTATGQQTQNTQNAQIQAFNQQQANAAQQFNQQAIPPTVSPESASQMAQTGPTTQELTEGRAREQQQATAGGVTGGGNVTFEETEGRAGTPKPGQAAGITPAATPITSEQSIAGVGGAGTAFWSAYNTGRNSGPGYTANDRLQQRQQRLQRLRKAFRRQWLVLPLLLALCPNKLR
jgi:hypothetical protein